SRPARQVAAVSTFRAEATAAAAAAPARAKEVTPEVRQVKEVREEENFPTLERGSIGTCGSCGFPVSGKRRLCVDCEAAQAKVNGGTVEAVAAPSYLSEPSEPLEGEEKRGWWSYVLAIFFIVAIVVELAVMWLRYH